MKRWQNISNKWQIEMRGRKRWCLRTWEEIKTDDVAYDLIKLF